jgi:hypothetical protein
MTTQHTPGPWIYDGKMSGGDLLISARVAPENSQTYIAPVAFVEGDWTNGIAEANARLIASAPIMYDYIKSSAANGCATAQAIIDSLK